MRRRRATPYADTAALQANTATNPRKTLVAMERRIDLHSSAHAKGSARPPARDRLRRHRFAGPRRRARRRPALGGADRAGGGASGGGSRRRARAGWNDDARRTGGFRPHSRLRDAPARFRRAGSEDRLLCVAPRTLRGDGAGAAVLAGALWAWADASGDLTAASRAALAAARALGTAPADPAAVLSLVAAQLEGAERDQACAVFRARLHAAGISACP